MVQMRAVVSDRLRLDSFDLTDSQPKLPGLTDRFSGAVRLVDSLVKIDLDLRVPRLGGLPRFARLQPVFSVGMVVTDNVSLTDLAFLGCPFARGDCHLEANL